MAKHDNNNRGLKLLFCIGLLMVLCAVAQAEQPRNCISCDWVSPDMTKSLFEVSHFAESNFNKPESLAELPNLMLKNGNLDRGKQTFLAELEQFREHPECKLDQVGKLTALEARLEEGEAEDGDGFKDLLLSQYLEKLHLNHYDTCKRLVDEKMNDWNSDLELKALRKTFANFAERLKLDLADFRKRNGKNMASFWFRGGPGMMVNDWDVSDEEKEDEHEHEFDLLNRGKTLVERDYLFEKVQSASGNFFGETEAACKETLRKHFEVGQKLDDLLEPFKWLSYYNGANFVHQKSKPMPKGRKLFGQLAKEHDEYLKSNKQLSDWMTLQGFLKKTRKRQDELCKRD